MIIEYTKLTDLLDRSGIPNQDVPARQALVIKFGSGNYKGPEDYDAVDNTGVHLDMNSDGLVLSIELY